MGKVGSVASASAYRRSYGAQLSPWCALRILGMNAQGIGIGIHKLEMVNDPEIDHDAPGIALKGFLKFGLGHGDQRKKQGQPKADPAP